jgi:hypothetical protein
MGNWERLIKVLFHHVNFFPLFPFLPSLGIFAALLVFLINFDWFVFFQTLGDVMYNVSTTGLE